jgi:hypothetical protein
MPVSLSRPSTRRGHKTDTSEPTRATPCDTSPVPRTARFAGKAPPRVIARARARRRSTSMARRGSTVRVRQRLCEGPAKRGFFFRSKRRVFEAGVHGKRCGKSRFRSLSHAGLRGSVLNRLSRTPPGGRDDASASVESSPYRLCPPPPDRGGRGRKSHPSQVIRP